MADLIAVYPNTEVAVTKGVMPALLDPKQHLQFGMTFEEQQEVLYQTLMAFQESKDD